MDIMCGTKVGNKALKLIAFAKYNKHNLFSALGLERML